MNRALRVAGIAVASLAAVLVIAALGLWWWSGTQSSLDWVLARVAASQSLQAEGVQGSLREGLKARHIAWEKEGLKVEVFDADLAWQPLAIVRATVEIEHLHAARLRIEDRRPPEPKKPPQDLTLPVRVEVNDLRVAQVQWVTREQDMDVRNIAGSYSFNAVSHHVKLDALQWMHGTYSGEARLDAGNTMALDAKLQGRLAVPVPGSTATAPLAFDVTLGGTLAAIDASARLQGTAGTATDGATAQARARVTPFDAQPVPQAQAEFQRLDVGALWPQAPHTRLDGKLHVQPAGAATWTLRIDTANTAPGPWEEHKLPVQQLTASADWHMEGRAVVHELQARTGGGTVTATGEWRQAGAWAIDGRLASVDPGAISTQLAHLPLSGVANVKGDGPVIGFDVDVKSAGKPADKAIAALALQSLRAQGRWHEGTLSLPLLDLRTSDASVQAALEVQPKAKAASGKASIDAPGFKLRADGTIAERSGAGRADLQASDIARALSWIARWPGVPDNVGRQLAGGRADAQVAWQGGWADPSVRARVNAPLVTLKGEAPWTVRDATLAVDGRLADAQVQLHARAEQAQRRVSVDATARGGRKGDAWQGRLMALNAAVVDPAFGAGAWTVGLTQPFDARWQGARFEAGAGQALLRSPRAGDAPAQVAWDPVRWGGGELQTAGRVTGLPLAWIELVGGPQLSGSAITGDMVFDAQWDARLGATPQLRASLVRSRGDITVLADDAEGRSVRVPAGVREARIGVETSGDQVTATLRWDSEHGGTADGRVTTRLARGGDTGWAWPDSAPVAGRVRAQLPRIGVWSLLAPPGWRLRGSLVASVDIAGTKGDPQLNGTLAADDLALRSVVDGVEMQNGRLRAHLEGRRVVIDEFTLHGSGANGGTLTAKGEGALTPAGPQASMTAELTKLRASIRSDRQLTVSGSVSARRDASGTVVNGKLAIDQALIVLPDQGTPRLGDDIVVRNAAAPITKREAKAQEDAAKKPQDKLQVAIDVDLGADFRVQGVGVDTHLRGTLAVAGESVAQPRITGTIRAVGGEYRAYGQRLDIDRGIIRFTGAPDNPALDVLAIRPNITQRVGVQVTGTAMAPYVRLYSEPDLPDAEKLAWLVTGRAAPATGAETALVQQAALALLASRSGGGKNGIAATLGLDELSFRREGSEGPSVTLGKRFSRNFYAAYERSLAGAVGTIYIFYDVTRKITVRAQAGERTAVDLIYTFAFD